MARRGGGQTYGFPIYCASWLPLAHILKPSPSAEEAADADASAADSSPSPPPMAALSGGGSEGRSGVPNALVVAALDPAADELNELETMEPASAACQEVITSAEGKPDPLLPTTSCPDNSSWDRWFQRVQ